MEKIKNFFSSRNTRVAAGSIGALILALLIFDAGMAVGRHHRHGHGAVGTISALSLPTFTMQTREGTGQTILVSTSTIIRGQASSTLSIGDTIVVLGEPDAQGRIDAKLIRILSGIPPAP